MRAEVNGKYVTIEPGVEIFYVDVGKGDAIVMIPGLSFNTEVFQAQIEYFSKTNRVIAFDPRGQGRSSKVLFGNDYTTHGKDLAKILEILNLNKVTLLGWSTGNLTVWSYAKEFGIEKIKSAILIDMSPKPISDNDKDWVECSFDDLCSISTQVLTTQEGQRNFFADYATQVMVQRKLSEEDLFFIVDISSRTPCHITNSLFASAVMGDFREGCKKLNDNVPTLIFIAEHWAEIAEPFMKRNYQKIQTVVMGGHLMFWEYPEKFNAELKQFLGW